MTSFRFTASSILSESLDWKKAILSIKQIQDGIKEKTLPGAAMMGWLDISSKDHDLVQIIEMGKRIRENSDFLLVVGTGGSTIGTKALYKLLSPYDESSLQFLGNAFDPHALLEIYRRLEGEKLWLNLVSHSGTTTEPLINFQLLEKHFSRIDPSWHDRVTVTTTKTSPLARYAADLSWPVFSIPDSIGGRFSVMTAVGLLPLAVCGIDIRALLEGYERALGDGLDCEGDAMSPAMHYAYYRYYCACSGYRVEYCVSWNAQWSAFLHWWRQLFAESEGKNNHALLPITGIFPSDLHTLGQFIQQGPQIMLEMMIQAPPIFTDKDNKYQESLLVPPPYLHHQRGSQPLGNLNQRAMDLVLDIHQKSSIPINMISLSSVDPYTIGYLVGFFMVSCTFSSYLQGVNPFNQPGVDIYKKAFNDDFGIPGLIFSS